MTFLTNITDFEKHKPTKDEIIINTNISIDDIKKNINRGLDKHHEICKYYIICVYIVIIAINIKLRIVIIDYFFYFI